MMNCQNAEILIEQRFHADLESEGVQAIETHLATCGSCRSYMEFLYTTEALMNQHAQASTQRMNWDEVQTAIAKWRRRSARNTTAILALVYLCIIPLIALVSGDSIRHELSTHLLGFVVLAWLFRQAQKKALRELQEAEDSSDALFAVYRRQLTKALKTRKQDVWVLPAICVPFLLVFVDPSRLESLAAGAGVLLIYGGLMAWNLLREIPSLKRQLEALSS